MPYLLRLRADTSVSTIQEALAYIRPRDIAFIFPFGAPVALASEVDGGVLHTLHLFCETLGKDVVIIGGDETLRAAAVAAGFAAATSLDAWKGASGSRFPRPAPLSEDEKDGPWPLSLSFVSAETDQETGQEADSDELPEYVRQLLGDDQGYTGPRDRDVALEARIARTTHPLDDDDDDIASIVSESYEDGITSTIRGTSGIGKRLDVFGASSGEEKSSDSRMR